MARVSARWPLLRPYVAGFCGLILVIGLSIVERLEAALSTMHRVGDVAARFGAVAALESLWSAEAAQSLMRAWRDWDADRLAGDFAPAVMSTQHAIAWYALIDTALVAVPAALLLWLLSGWAREIIRAEATDLSQMRERAPESRHDSVVRWRALCQVASTARLVALAYLALDILENTTMWLLSTADKAPLSALRALGFVSLLKLVTLIAAAGPLVLVIIAARDRAGGLLRAIGHRLAALRGQLLVVVVLTAAFLALRGDIGSQVDDVVMRWAEQPEHGLSAVIVTVVLTLLLALTGYACYDHYADPPVPAKKELSLWSLLVLGFGGLLVAGGGLALALVADLPIGYPIVFPGAVLALFSVASARKAVRAVKPPPPTHTGNASYSPSVLVWTLAAIPLAALGLVIVRSAVTLAVTREGFVGFGLLGLGLIMLAALAVVGHLGPWNGARWPQRAVIGLSALVVLTAGYAALRPMQVGGQLGALALLLLLLVVVLLILTGLHWAGDAVSPRGALALLRMRRTPFIFLVVCWFAATSLMDQTASYHDVRLGDELPADYKALTIDEAFNSWLAQQTNGPVVDGKQQVPMLFIATAGGGIRSAYWTGLVLDCLFSARPIEPGCAGQPIDKATVFAASGVSGGSLGLAVDRAVEDTGGTFADVLERDFLSPDIAALAFRDLPNYLLRLEPQYADRAAVMEQAWEAAITDPGNPLRQGFFASARRPGGQPRFPILMLNSATVDDGCRLNASTLDASARVETGPVPPTGTEGCLSLTPFEPGREDADNPVQSETLAGSKDLFQFICQREEAPQHLDAPDARQPIKHDIPLSAAAHLSARFPYISPTGALTSCSWPQRRTYALDGGLLEASAVSPLTEMWARLAGRIHEVNNDPTGRHCIEPRLLMIDNGYATATSTSDGGRPAELVAPASGLSRFNSSWAARAEQAAALAFDHAFSAVACRGAGGVAIAPRSVVSRVAHIYPTARPGPRAPLGWSLSQYARHDLTTQAHSPANMCQVALVRSWLSETVPAGATRCVTGFAIKADTTSKPPPATIAMLAPPIEPNAIGVPGVRVSAAPDSGPACNHGTTTDATGRFYLLVPAGPPATLTVCWAGATFTVPVPSGNSPLITSDNFAVAIPDP